MRQTFIDIGAKLIGGHTPLEQPGMRQPLEGYDPKGGAPMMPKVTRDKDGSIDIKQRTTTDVFGDPEETRVERVMGMNMDKAPKTLEGAILQALHPGSFQMQDANGNLSTGSLLFLPENAQVVRPGISELQKNLRPIESLNDQRMIVAFDVAGQKSVSVLINDAVLLDDAQQIEVARYFEENCADPDLAQIVDIPLKGYLLFKSDRLDPLQDIDWAEATTYHSRKPVGDAFSGGLGLPLSKSAVVAEIGKVLSQVRAMHDLYLHHEEPEADRSRRQFIELVRPDGLSARIQKMGRIERAKRTMTLPITGSNTDLDETRVELIFNSPGVTGESIYATEEDIIERELLKRQIAEDPFASDDEFTMENDADYKP